MGAGYGPFGRQLREGSIQTEMTGRGESDYSLHDAP